MYENYYHFFCCGRFSFLAKSSKMLHTISLFVVADVYIPFGSLKYWRHYFSRNLGKAAGDISFALLEHIIFIILWAFPPLSTSLRENWIRSYGAEEYSWHRVAKPIFAHGELTKLTTYLCAFRYNVSICRVMSRHEISHAI